MHVHTLNQRPVSLAQVEQLVDKQQEPSSVPIIMTWSEATHSLTEQLCWNRALTNCWFGLLNSHFWCSGSCILKKAIFCMVASSLWDQRANSPMDLLLLTQRKMCVVVEGEKSRPVNVGSGVPQGTVLRKKCYLRSSWSKTSHFYSINDQILKQVQENLYLGLTISDNLKWKTHINNICKKANTSYTMLGFLRRNLRHCPKPCRKNAYLALVRSKVEYGSIIWDPYNQSDIDRLERI